MSPAEVTSKTTPDTEWRIADDDDVGVGVDVEVGVDVPVGVIGPRAISVRHPDTNVASTITAVNAEASVEVVTQSSMLLVRLAEAPRAREIRPALIMSRQAFTPLMHDHVAVL